MPRLAATSDTRWQHVAETSASAAAVAKASGVELALIRSSVPGLVSSATMFVIICILAPLSAAEAKNERP